VVGVAVIVTSPVAVPTKVAVPVVPVPLTVIMFGAFPVQVEAMVEVRVIELFPEPILRVFPFVHPLVQVTVFAASPTVTGMVPKIVASLALVAVIVIALVVVVATAVILPLSLVLLTLT